MIFLTVVFSVAATIAAIRVPPVWPKEQPGAADLGVEQSDYQRILDDFDKYVFPTETFQRPTRGPSLYTPNLAHQTADGVYATSSAQHKRRPSGSHAEFATINREKTQPPKEQPNVQQMNIAYYVSHSPGKKRHPPLLQASSNQIISHNPGAATKRHNNPKNPPFSQPLVYVDHNADFPTSPDGWVPIAGQKSSPDAQEPNNLYGNHNFESRRKAPNPSPNRRRHPAPLNLKRRYKNSNDRSDTEVGSTRYSDPPSYRSVRINSQGAPESEEGSQENGEETPVSQYEAHKDVPTKPIYPGEGMWAVFGLKHQPFISRHNYRDLQDDGVKPEGYETFEKAAPVFERQQRKFTENLQALPERHNLGTNVDEQDEASTAEDLEEQTEAEEETENDGEVEDAFEPTKLLAQVRKTEDKKYLPSDPADARLREVIKDSKIHTVYIEEGYEDVAYDHAGHEKNAEDSEGHTEVDKGVVTQKRKYPKVKKAGFDAVNVSKEFENYDDPTENEAERRRLENTSDAEASASGYDHQKPNGKNTNTNKNKYATTKEHRTTEIKNTKGGDMELEITSEVKIMTQPNNVSTAHKFVKIVPKSKPSNDVNVEIPPIPENVHRRHKRFVNDFPKIEVEKDFLDVLKNDKNHAPPPEKPTEKYPYYRIQNTELLNKNSPLRYAEDLKNIPHKIEGQMSFYEHTKASECPEIPSNVNPIPDRVHRLENNARTGEEVSEQGGPAEQPDLPRLRNLGDKIDCLKVKYFGENPLDSPIFQESVIEAPESIFSGPDFFSDLEHLRNTKYLQQDEESDQSDFKPNDEELEEYSNIQAHEEYAETGEAFSASDVSEKYDKIDANRNVTSQDVPLESVEQNSPPPLHQQSMTVADFTTNRSTVKPVAKIVPKHIYDQIDLADSLDGSDALPTTPKNLNSEVQKVTTTQASFEGRLVYTTEKSYVSTTTSDDTVDDSKTDYSRGYKDHFKDSQRIPNNTANEVDTEMLYEAVDEDSDSGFQEDGGDRQSKAFILNVDTDYPNEDTGKELHSSNSQSDTPGMVDSKETLPESLPLRIRKRRRRRPQRPMLQIFDINRFLPTPLPPLVTFPTTNTVLPKYKTLSEVYYKDDIQPNEQLNVFADVINNIKNSPSDALLAEGSEVREETTSESALTKTSVRKLKVPPRKVRIKQSKATPYSTTELYITSTTTSTTTVSPRRRRRNKYKNHKPDDQIYEEYLAAINENAGSYNEIKVPKKTRSEYPRQKKKPQGDEIEDSYISEDASYSKPDIGSVAALDDIVGLAPPYSLRYPSAYKPADTQNPSLAHAVTKQGSLNTFIVPGMKPPGKHKPLSYSDFKVLQLNRIRRKNNYHRIRKRSAHKPSYSEIKRNRPTQDPSTEQNEDDDYVPQRNRNFRYDTENDRIIYTKKKEEEEEPLPEVEEEAPAEVEVEDEEGGDYLYIVKKPTPTPFVVITTERNGPSFLDYLYQLKNNSEYRVILDPQPIKKSSEGDKKKMDSTEAESTTKQVESIVPDFLGIVCKLKANDNYKPIAEKKVKSTTTASPEKVEYEEVEDSDADDYKNSRGGSLGYDKSQIFDITEYLPQPKVVIDYSKYKTIERTPAPRRHNYSSRYSEDDDDLSLNNHDATQVPILAASDRKEDNIKITASEHVSESRISEDSQLRRSGFGSSEESADEEVAASTTASTTEAQQVTTLRSRRLRGRSRKRPTTTTPTTTTETSTASPRTTFRRTRGRSRPTTTTTAEPALEENYSQTQRIARRRFPVERHSRQNQKIPHNHKEFYTPLSIEDGADDATRHVVVQRKRKVSRLVTPEQTQLPVNDSSKQEVLGKPGEIQPRKLSDVVVFSKYDPSKRHGGNYQHEGDDSPQAGTNSVPPTAYEIEDSKEIQRLTDVVPKPFAFYSDPTLPGSVNQLKEPKDSEQLPAESEEAEFPPKGQGKTNTDYNEDYTDEVRIHFNNFSETATKKPVYFIKDPGKRLYYYAPVK